MTVSKMTDATSFLVAIRQTSGSESDSNHLSLLVEVRNLGEGLHSVSTV